MDAVGPYRILGTLGSGGMGTVYHALDPGSGRELALKVVRRDIGRGQPETTERFLREVRAAQALDHPGIVEVYGAGRAADGTLWMAMEKCQGEDLASRLKRGPMTVADACEVAADVALALAHAHGRGVVHRDLKPANVFLTPQGPKLLDFGVARLASTTARLTAGNVILGTPEYMSPEQARNEPDVDGRADLYSLGAILFESLTGVPPFTGDGPLAVMVRVLTEPVRPVSSLRVDVPPDVERLVSSLLVKERDRRRSDAAEVAVELREAARRASSPSFPAPVASPARSEMRIVTVLAVLDLPDPGVLGSAVRAEGGIEDYLGNGETIAVFGAELSFGDEPVRALRAAIAARPRGARIGVATGRARASSGGEVAGTAVEQAVRLARGAGPEGIRLCAATAEAARGLFQVRRMPDGAFDLVGERPGGVAVRAFRTTFVGREKQLGQLLGLFARTVLDGEPGAVIIVGHAGIGKTRLKDELRGALESRAGSIRTLEARADPLRSSVPYAAVSDALRARIRPGASALGENVVTRPWDTIPAGERDPDSPSTPVARVPGQNVALVRKSTLKGPPGDAQRRVRSASSIDLLPHLTRYLDRLGQPAADAEVIGLAMGIRALERHGAEIPSQVAGATAPVAAPRPGPRSSPRAIRSRMEDALVAALVAEARQAPVLFVVEDLQWADVDSLAVLDRALHDARGFPLLVVGLARPELLDSAPALFARARRTVLRLGPLDPEASRALVREVLRARPEVGESAELILHIEATAAGNPLYLQELAACAIPGSSLVPMSVENALQAHFDELGSSERELLKNASVMGLCFWDAALVALGLDAAHVSRGLARLCTLELILPRASSRFEGASEYGFSHALLRDAAHSRLPDEERAKLHLELARWLEEAGEPDAAVLAHHHAMGGDRVRAASYLVQAAEAALGAFANESAVAHAGAALAMVSEREGAPPGFAPRAPRPSGRIRLDALAAREEALHRLGRHGDQERDVALLEAESVTDEDRVLALSRRARILRARGSLAEATECLERAIALPAAAGRLRADLSCQISESHLASGRHRRAMELSHDAVDLARACGEVALEARALWCLARAEGAVGNLGPSLEDHRRALELLEATDDVSSQLPCLLSLARVEIIAGRPDDAERSVRKAQRLPAAGRDAALDCHSEEVLSLCLSTRREGGHARGGEARIAAMRAIELAERAGSAERRASALVALGRAEGALGSAEAVADAAAEALEIATEHGLVEVGVRSRIELCRARLACGELAEARRLAEDALDRRLAGGPCPADHDDELHVALARCRLATGDREAAYAAAGRAVEVAAHRARSLPAGPARDRYLASAAASIVAQTARDMGLNVFTETLTAFPATE
ncbi:MAG: protein kinase [Deltaproteobacteria bacterium]|nr:protein kinase [Deltaproteobacteria bacterium]